MGRFLAGLGIALLVYMVWKSPASSSAGIGMLWHAFVAIGNGCEAILDALTGKHG